MCDFTVCVILQHVICGCGPFAGVQMIRVGLLAEKADIRYNPSVVTPDQLVESVKSLGFGAVLAETVNTNEGKIELSVSRVTILCCTA